MPQRNGRPSFLARGFGRLVDTLAKGNNYNPQTGQYSNVGKGLLARAAQVGATAIGGPLLGQLVGQGGTNWVNTGNPLDFTGNDSRIAQLVNAFTRGGNPGAVERMPFALDGSVQVPNVGGSMPTFNPVVATSNEGRALPSLGTRNLFAGGSGNFGPAGGREYGQAAGSFTPAGAGVVQVAGQGWGGSDAAAGFGLGAQGAGATSAGQIALADAIAAAKRNLR